MSTYNWSLRIPPNTPIGKLAYMTIDRVIQYAQVNGSGTQIPAIDSQVLKDFGDWYNVAIKKAGGISQFANQPNTYIVTNNGVVVQEFDNGPAALNNTNVTTTTPPATPPPDPLAPLKQATDLLTLLRQFFEQIIAPFNAIAKGVNTFATTANMVATNTTAFITWVTDIHTIERLAAVGIGLVLLFTGLSAFTASFFDYKDIAKAVETIGAVAA